jgi:hypothetical protein
MPTGGKGNQPEYDVAVGFALFSRGAEAIDDVGSQPDEPLVLVVDRRLVGDRPERERGGERVEGGGSGGGGGM